MFVAGPDATGPRVMAAVAALQGRAAAGGPIRDHAWPAGSVSGEASLPTGLAAGAEVPSHSRSSCAVAGGNTLLARLIGAKRAGQAAAGIPLDCLARLQRAFDVGHTRPGPRSGTAPTAVPGLVGQLTSRELEVLTMLAAGKPNQAIAGQLVVTLDTVKKHVSHVLGKLGAANRTEAVTRARELGLIP